MKNLVFKVGDKVLYRYEGESLEFGVVVDVVDNWEEVLRKGGSNLDEWESLFNSEEYCLEMGYNCLEDWKNSFVSRLKSGVWYKIEGVGWFSEEYVEEDDIVVLERFDK